MLSHQPPLAVPVVSKSATPSQLQAAAGSAISPASVASASGLAVGTMHDPAHLSTAVMESATDLDYLAKALSVDEFDPILVTVLKAEHHDSATHARVCEHLYDLSPSEENLDAAGKAGVFEALCATMTRYSANEQVLVQACAAICQLTGGASGTHAANRELAGMAGACQALVTVLTTHPTAFNIENFALWALNQLTQLPVNVMRLEAAGGLAAVTAALQIVEEHIRTNVARSIYRERIFKNGAQIVARLQSRQRPVVAKQPDLAKYYAQKLRRPPLREAQRGSLDALEKYFGRSKSDRGVVLCLPTGAGWFNADRVFCVCVSCEFVRL